MTMEDGDGIVGNEEGGKQKRLTHQQCILFLNAVNEPVKEGPVEGRQEATHEHQETVIEKGWKADEAFHDSLADVSRIAILFSVPPPASDLLTSRFGRQLL